MIHPASTFHQAAEAEILRRTSAPNEAACVRGAGQPADTDDEEADGRVPCRSLSVQLLSADPDFDTIPGPLARLMREIADGWARDLIEQRALWMREFAPTNVYDCTKLDPERRDAYEEMEADELADLQKAVQYLEMRALVHRPIPGYPALVAFCGSMA